MSLPLVAAGLLSAVVSATACLCLSVFVCVCVVSTCKNGITVRATLERVLDRTCCTHAHMHARVPHEHTRHAHTHALAVTCAARTHALFDPVRSRQRLQTDTGILAPRDRWQRRCSSHLPPAAQSAEHPPQPLLRSLYIPSSTPGLRNQPQPQHQPRGLGPGPGPGARRLGNVPGPGPRDSGGYCQARPG